MSYKRANFSVNHVVICAVLLAMPVMAMAQDALKARGLSGEGVPVSTSTVPMDTAPVSEEQVVPRFYPESIEELQRLKDQELAPRLREGTSIEDKSAFVPESPPLAPAPVTDFPGISWTGWIPPDPILDVGPNHVVVVVNSSWAVYDKSGTQLYQTTLGNWFSNVNPPGDPFDPKVIYDHHAGRWIILALAKDSTSQSSLLISVSQSSDPMGSWWNWNLDATLNGATPTSNFWDYPGLGFDSDSAIYLTGNMFSFSGDFQYAKLRILSCFPEGISSFYAALVCGLGCCERTLAARSCLSHSVP